MSAPPMISHRVYVDGVAFWAPSLPGWTAARAAFRGEGEPADPPARRPAPQLLEAAERRRASDTVALALEVAAAAVAASGHPPAALPSVFVSAHGDLAINDYMCTTLAADPTAISPTKFHNSVHNAPAGYWTIGAACREASTALTAFEHSFAAGLLEAATQCIADSRPVLLVGCDVNATGALATVTTSRGLLAAALVLSPERGAQTVAAIDWSLRSGPAVAPRPPSPAAQALTLNAIADCLPLFEALAGTTFPQLSLQMPLAPMLSLHLNLSPAA